jgi:hypothetical protein
MGRGILMGSGRLGLACTCARFQFFSTMGRSTDLTSTRCDTCRNESFRNRCSLAHARINNDSGPCQELRHGTRDTYFPDRWFGMSRSSLSHGVTTRSAHTHARPLSPAATTTPGPFRLALLEV